MTLAQLDTEIGQLAGARHMFPEHGAVEHARLNALCDEVIYRLVTGTVPLSAVSAPLDRS